MSLGSGIRDPGYGKNLFRIPDPGVKKAPDPGSGIGKKSYSDPGTGSGMNNPDHISESLETIFWG
jgi:hypothetical protein